MRAALITAALVACVAQAGALAAPAENSNPSNSGLPTAPDAVRVAPRPTGAVAAVVEQPRPTGYFVGDLFTQRVLLDADGHSYTPVTLPAVGRVSAWFERRRETVATDSALRHWLVVEYQILNASQKLVTVQLPAWQLAVRGGAGGAVTTLRIPATSISVATLSPPGSPEQVGVRDLRLDRVPPVIAIAPIRRNMALSFGALMLTLVAWAGWLIWRNRRATATQPFASALREMRSLDEREPRAWQALHRAFDRTAGRVIQGATLPALFEKAPHLTPLRAQIEQFFAQSSLLFFGTGAPTTAHPRELCAELRRVERRHER